MPSAQKEKLSVSVVIPALNEEDGISEVLKGVRHILEKSRGTLLSEFEIIVVDDGSDDGTAEIAESCGARVVRHPINMGYGKSLLTGFESSRFDWILMTDADGSYPTEEIADILPYAPDFDMVIGARQGSLFWGSPLRAVMRRAYLLMAGFVAGYKIPDANSGLRLIRKNALVKTMPVLCYGYSFSTTMTLSFLQAGRFVKFAPVPYRARKGRSKVNLIRDILRTIQIMVQVILYYNPLKFAALLTCLPVGLAVFFGARWAQRAGFGDLAMLAASLLSALFVFLLGCVLDQQRLHRR